MSLKHDSRTVLTLDAGGTNFVFNAVRGGEELLDPVRLPAEGHDLEKSLSNIIEGFTEVIDNLSEKPFAISFAFPGPADYPSGIIGNLNNLTGYRGGVALGPMLQEKFKLPTFINNDADLFAYGEAISGFLPYINDELAKTGNPKKYTNLLGITLGTGLGGGVIIDNKLMFGDNSLGAEVWAMRNKFMENGNAEEGACIRAVKRYYFELTGKENLEPKDIAEIAQGKQEGDQAAAIKSFELLGEVVGDILVQLCSTLDTLVVIGGGISAAHELFIPALIKEMSGNYDNPNGSTRKKLVHSVYNLEDKSQLSSFTTNDSKVIKVPYSDSTVVYHDNPKIGVGVSKLGTSKAVSVGAYAYALSKLPN